MATVTLKVEGKRGCGYRKPGGIYLISDGAGFACDKLPIPLTVCPCCNAGIKQSRGFEWIGRQLLDGKKCSKVTESGSTVCPGCPFYNTSIERYGLMWVGEKFYPTAKALSLESVQMGISKRISQVPREFKVGKTWVLLAHPKAIMNTGDENTPGIFSAFCPSRIEYVVTGKETEEELDRLEDRGFSLVKVVPDKAADLHAMFEEDGE
jgi:RNA polymerase subunit RPABC4/transcription elongation factor Spt4